MIIQSTITVKIEAFINGELHSTETYKGQKDWVVEMLDHFRTSTKHKNWNEKIEFKVNELK